MAKVQVKPNQKGRKQFLENFNAAIQALTTDWNSLTQAQKQEALRESTVLNLRAVRAILRQALDD